MRTAILSALLAGMLLLGGPLPDAEAGSTVPLGAGTARPGALDALTLPPDGTLSAPEAALGLAALGPRERWDMRAVTY